MTTVWAMTASIVTVCSIILALIWVPGLRPSDDVLACDRMGGYWSNLDEACIRSDSPLAGLAS
ncbi:MAG: hypothetical protein AAF674_02625 [Pseudomonadota bacterium]